MDGIDRYEAERIAHDEAVTEADAAKREIGYELETIRRDIDRLGGQIADLSADINRRLVEIWESVNGLQIPEE